MRNNFVFISTALVTALMTPISEEVLDAADFVVPCITTNKDWETSLSGPGDIRQYWNILINETVKRHLLNNTLKEEFYKYFDSNPTTWGTEKLFFICGPCGACICLSDHLTYAHPHIHTHVYTRIHIHTIAHSFLQ